MNDAKYNRALHCRARGKIKQFLGDLQTAKPGAKTRNCILSVPSIGEPDRAEWNVAVLLYNAGALLKEGDEVECRGPVVDYGTRLEGAGKTVKPKLVFAASVKCYRAQEQEHEKRNGKRRYATAGMSVAMAGRIAWCGEKRLSADLNDEGLYDAERDVGVAVSDFPALIGLEIFRKPALEAKKHCLIYAEAEVVRFGLSDDGKRPALKGRTTRAALGFVS